MSSSQEVQCKLINKLEINSEDITNLNVFYLLGKYKDRIERLDCIVNPKISRKLVSDINNLIVNYPTDSFLGEYQHVIVNPYFGTGITPFAKGDFVLDNTLYHIDFSRKNDYSKEKMRVLTGYVLFHIIQQEYVHKDNKHYREDMAQLQYIDKFVIYNPRVNTLLICSLPPYGVLFNAAIELKLYYEEQLRRFKGLY